jgi:hypothetical protein
MSPRKKAVIGLGRFCLVKMEAVRGNKNVELHLLPESAAQDALSEMRFHLGNMAMICVVPKSVAETLLVQEIYTLELHRLKAAKKPNG